MLTYFKRIYEYWLAFGHAIGLIMTPVQLFLIYGLVFGPARIVTLVARRDPLDRGLSPEPSFWKEKQPLAHTIEEVRHQF